jgi:hypothetical protein
MSGRQLGYLVRHQTVEPQPLAMVLHQPLPSFIGLEGSFRAGGQQAQDLVSGEAPEGKSQGPSRRLVDPMQILDDKDNRSTGLKGSQYLQKLAAGCHGIDIGGESL